MTNWRENSFSRRPTKRIDAFAQIFLADTCKFSPLTKIHSPSVNSYYMVGSSVVGLFFAICPHTVFKGIAFIIINSFYGKLWRRAFAHVFKECHKIFSPFLANSDATATIIFKSFFVWVGAPLNDTCPCFVFRSRIHTMNKSSFNEKFGSNTTATLGSTRFQMVSMNSGYVSTTTLASPASSTPFSIFSTFKNGKAIKGLSGKINEIMIGHYNNLQARLQAFWSAAGGRLSTTFRGIPLSA